MRERREPEGVGPRMEKRLNSTTIALIGGLALVLIMVVYFAASRNAEQDRLSDSQVTQEQPADAEKSCASKATYDLIKHELFRRAAQLRGSDQPAYDKLSAFAVIRMDNPVMESDDANTGAVNCSGSLSLDLPPGVTVVGGRRSLMADVDYTVQPAADGSGPVVLLRNADAIIAPLATLAKVEQPAQPAAPVETNEVAPVETNGIAPVAPQPPAVPAKPAGARPSFDCANARSKGEIAVCSDAGLAALDRNMAAQYGRSIATASPEQRDQLRQTRDRFLAYRDRCPNRSCIGDAYVGRMREIRDIMEGHWTPPR